MGGGVQKNGEESRQKKGGGTRGKILKKGRGGGHRGGKRGGVGCSGEEREK